jgi:O-antigen/teichoic acid export membrane protein
MPSFSSSLLRGMLRIGTPLGLTTALTLGLQTVDRLVVAALGGIELLGYYAFAGSIAGAAASGVLVVRTVVFPDVYRHAGTVGGARATRRLIEDTIAPFVLVYGALLGLASFAIGPLIQLFVPEYVDVVLPARLLIFAGATTGLSGLASIGLVAVARQRVLPQLAAVAFGFNLVASAWLLHAGFGLTAIATAAGRPEERCCVHSYPWPTVCRWLWR